MQAAGDRALLVATMAAVVASAAAFRGALRPSGARGFESLPFHGKGGAPLSTLTPKAVAEAVVITEAEVVGVGVGPIFRAGHGACGGFGCAARRDSAEGHIGLGNTRQQAVTAKTGGKRRGRRGVPGSCLVVLVDRWEMLLQTQPDAEILSHRSDVYVVCPSTTFGVHNSVRMLLGEGRQLLRLLGTCGFIFLCTLAHTRDDPGKVFRSCFLFSVPHPKRHYSATRRCAKGGSFVCNTLNRFSFGRLQNVQIFVGLCRTHSHVTEQSPAPETSSVHVLTCGRCRFPPNRNLTFKESDYFAAIYLFLKVKYVNLLCSDIS